MLKMFPVNSRMRFPYVLDSSQLFGGFFFPFCCRADILAGPFYLASGMFGMHWT